MPEYRPTPGGTLDTAIQGDLIGPGDNAAVAGDDTDPPEQGESLLGGGNGADEGTFTDQEFSPGFPIMTVPSLASRNANAPVPTTYDPYADLDGLFVTPQPLSARAANGRTGPQDDLLF